MVHSTQRIRAVDGGWRTPSTLAFYALIPVGFALRVAFAGSAAYRLDSDSVIVYLMARRVSEGEIAAFFWGQSYGGTLLQSSAGLVMAVLGDDEMVLVVVSVLYWLGAAVLLRLIVLRSVNRRAGDVAGALMWFPGAAILGTSVIDPGFYGPSLVVGLGALWIVTRWWRAMTVPLWLAVGALCGLALWTSPMAVALATPALVAAMWSDRRWRLWLLAAAVALVAALPWLIETVRSSLGSVRPLGEDRRIHWESFASLFTTMFPASFPLGDQELPQFFIALALVASIAGVIVQGVRTRTVGAVLIGAATILLILVLVLGSGVRLAADSARYSAFMIPVAAFAIAWLVARMRWPATGVMAAAPTVTLLLVLSGTNGLAPSVAGRYDGNFAAIREVLAQRDITAGYGAYWMAYPFTASVDEQFTLASLVPRRYAPYEEAASRQSRTAMVVYLDHENDRMLSTHVGLPEYERIVVGGYAVYVFESRLDPYILPLGLF